MVAASRIALTVARSYQEGTLNSGRTAVTGTPSQSQSWSFDQLGNWNSVTTNGTTQTRTANAQNEYTAVGSATPTYDNNGNMTTDAAGLKFTYDAWNRVVTVTNAAGATTLETFSYDGQDRRITITASGTTTNLFYSNQWQVLEESTGGSYTQRYVWSPVYVNAMVLRDSLVTTGPSPRYWVIQDGNWNVVAIVLSGSVVERYDYTPFGTVTYLAANGTLELTTGGAPVTASTQNWTYLFQGGHLDLVAGSYAFQERDYDPTLGRWRTVDPIGFRAGDQDLYRYVGNLPTDAIDSSGLLVVAGPAVAAGVGAAGGGGSAAALGGLVGIGGLTILGSGTVGMPSTRAQQSNGQGGQLFVDWFYRRYVGPKPAERPPPPWRSPEPGNDSRGQSRGGDTSPTITPGGSGGVPPAHPPTGALAPGGDCPDSNNPLNWSWKSQKTFGHTFNRHGAGATNMRNLAGRAAGTGDSQGQWLNNDAAAEFLRQQRPGLTEGAIVDLPSGVQGHVIRPDGTIVPATRAQLVPNPSGGYRTAYPIE